MVPTYDFKTENIDELNEWTSTNKDGFVLRIITEKKKKRKTLHCAYCKYLKKDYKNEYDKKMLKPLARKPEFECYTSAHNPGATEGQKCSKCNPCTTYMQ